MLGEVAPNPAHLALAELERRGLVRAVVTQNIDLLHERAGSRDVVEVHGSIRTSSCPACGGVYPLAEVEPLIEAHGAPPCPACGAILKPDVVFFDELLPEAAITRAVALAEEARAPARGRLVARGLPGGRPAALDPRRGRQGRGRQPHADVGGRPRRAGRAGERGGDPGRGRCRAAGAAARGRGVRSGVARPLRGRGRPGARCARAGHRRAGAHGLDRGARPRGEACDRHLGRPRARGALAGAGRGHGGARLRVPRRERPARPPVLPPGSRRAGARSTSTPSSTAASTGTAIGPCGDYLRAHPDEVERYAGEKRRLAAEAATHADYWERKQPYMDALFARAWTWYPGRP